jgi:hypothetical protein
MLSLATSITYKPEIQLASYLHLNIHARVAWSSDLATGLQFREPLAAEVRVDLFATILAVVHGTELPAALEAVFHWPVTPG